MTIRTNTNPRQMDLQPEMRNLLMRNGLQAHVAFDGGGYRLIVQGHDSPLLVYPITERQMLALTDWGTNTANKKAYNILTSIIGKDFYMPKISSMPVMPTVAWRWGYMATASVLVSTDTWGDWVCPLHSLVGHHANSGVSTYAELVGSFSFRGHPSYPNAQTGA